MSINIGEHDKGAAEVEFWGCVSVGGCDTILKD
jgi:hypothetical protein